MDPFPHEIPERRIDRALALQPAHPREPGRLDLDGEMAFAAAVVAGMAAMLRAVVDHGEPCRREGGTQAFFDFLGDRTG